LGLAILDRSETQRSQTRTILNECILRSNLGMNIGNLAFQIFSVLASFQAIYQDWKKSRMQKNKITPNSPEIFIQNKVTPNQPDTAFDDQHNPKSSLDRFTDSSFILNHTEISLITNRMPAENKPQVLENGQNIRMLKSRKKRRPNPHLTLDEPQSNSIEKNQNMHPELS